MNQPMISEVYHNRCVLLGAEHMAKAGIQKNDRVTLRVEDDAIVIRKAYILDSATPRQDVDDVLERLQMKSAQDTTGNQ